jgi:hypothetical protein
MHPVMTEQLAAERIREMVARGDAARRARQGHRARHDQRARARRAAATQRSDSGPAADWTSPPMISVRSADGTGR